jgi:hypothetical protein
MIRAYVFLLLSRLLFPINLKAAVLSLFFWGTVSVCLALKSPQITQTTQNHTLLNTHTESERVRGLES